MWNKLAIKMSVCRIKTQTTQKMRLDLIRVMRDAFTIGSSTPTLRINLIEHPIEFK
jgi:hypothetical protein